MAANIGSQPWLTRPLSPQPHTRQKRRACDFYLSVFDSPTLPPRFSNTQVFLEEHT